MSIRRERSRSAALAGVALLFGMAACANDEQSIDGGDFGIVASPDPEVLPDSAIAHIALSINEAALAEGQWAERSAARQEVRDLARETVASRHLAVDREQALFERLHITPLEDARSAELRNESDDAIAELDLLDGIAFDQRYLVRQIDADIAALVLIDTTLLPDSRLAEIEEEIGTLRASISLHLERAREVQASVTGTRGQGRQISP